MHVGWAACSSKYRYRCTCALHTCDCAECWHVKRKLNTHHKRYCCSLVTHLLHTNICFAHTKAAHTYTYIVVRVRENQDRDAPVCIRVHIKIFTSRMLAIASRRRKSKEKQELNEKKEEEEEDVWKKRNESYTLSIAHTKCSGRHTPYGAHAKA